MGGGGLGVRRENSPKKRLGQDKGRYEERGFCTFRGGELWEGQRMGGAPMAEKGYLAGSVYVDSPMCWGYSCSEDKVVLVVASWCEQRGNLPRGIHALFQAGRERAESTPWACFFSMPSAHVVLLPEGRISSGLFRVQQCGHTNVSSPGWERESQALPSFRAHACTPKSRAPPGPSPAPGMTLNQKGHL